MIDLKDKLLELVKSSISQELLLREINKSIRAKANDIYFLAKDNEEYHYELLQGCQYDDYFNDICQADYDVILDVEFEEWGVITSIIEILKDVYGVSHVEIFENFDKVGVTLEEALLEIDENAQIREYDKFYPRDGRFLSLTSSDQRMLVVKFTKSINISFSVTGKDGESTITFPFESVVHDTIRSVDDGCFIDCRGQDFGKEFYEIGNFTGDLSQLKKDLESLDFDLIDFDVKNKV